MFWRVHNFQNICVNRTYSESLWWNICENTTFTRRLWIRWNALAWQHLALFWPLPPLHGFHFLWSHKRVTQIEHWSEWNAWLWTGLEPSTKNRPRMRHPFWSARQVSSDQGAQCPRAEAADCLHHLFLGHRYRASRHISFISTRVLEGFLLISVSVTLQNQWFPLGKFVLPLHSLVTWLNACTEDPTVQVKSISGFDLSCSDGQNIPSACHVDSSVNTDTAAKDMIF